MAYPNSGVAIEKPKVLNELLKYARILSEDFLHARTDFYIVDGKVVFGEITFSNSAGFGRGRTGRICVEDGKLFEAAYQVNIINNEPVKKSL